MEPGQRLKDLLQHQLATDFSAIRNIPYTISVLTPDCFTPSSYLTKWVSRTNSLIHSKESAARWAGICLAYKSAQFSQELMVESAQGWMGAVLPLLSVRVDTIGLYAHSEMIFTSRDPSRFLP